MEGGTLSTPWIDIYDGVETQVSRDRDFGSRFESFYIACGRQKQRQEQYIKDTDNAALSCHWEI
ncbi:hypothetical protein MAR_027276 [Mya arenaria]|uniref:Uncharacterized protein n=1 Tax=Mya arenaria TaxID=6604 RepID=A0ABY7EW93_MYAAR|nr:hypothetical protein MAR_027276 [Mya arenaria]